MIHTFNNPNNICPLKICIFAVSTKCMQLLKNILIDFILGDCVDERVIAVLPIFVFVLRWALFIFKRWCPKILRKNIDHEKNNH